MVELHVDPVCKCNVGEPKISGEYEGKKIYFCSAECKGEFEANPLDYIKDFVGPEMDV